MRSRGVMATTTQQAMQNLTQNDVDLILHRVNRLLRQGDTRPTEQEFENGLVEALRHYGRLIQPGSSIGQRSLFHDKAAAVILQPFFFSNEHRCIEDDNKLAVVEPVNAPETLLEKTRGLYDASELLS